MVQEIILALIESLKRVGDTLIRIGPQIALVIAGAGVAAVLLWASDRQNFGDRVNELLNRSKPIGKWIVFALLTGTAWLFLQDVSGIYESEQSRQRFVQYTSKEDASASGVLQYGPIAAYVQEKTFSRTLTLPPTFLERIGVDGVQVLSPYLQDPSAENVLKLADTFRRSGQDVVFTREVTRLEEVPISISKAEVDVKLDFRESGAASQRSYYDAAFNAKYTFKNPLSTETTARFRILLPWSGTVRDFEVAVNGKAVMEPEEDGSYQWEGPLAGGETAVATVRYKTQGGGSWRYDVGTGRRRIESFTLRVDADEPARFLRGALFPTSQSGNVSTWELQNVITNRQIDILFPGRGSASEAGVHAMGFLPLAMAAFLGLAWMVSWKQKRLLDPVVLTVATLGFSFGLAALAVAILYVPLFLAILLSGLVSTGLVVRTLGWSYLPAAGLASILPLAFTSELHSGMIVLIAVVLAFVALAPKANLKENGE